VRERADTELDQKSRHAEQLVLEENLVDHFLRTSEQHCATR
jgi:hypothetical protein